MSESRATHGAYARSATALAIRASKTRRLVQRLRILCPWIEDSDLPTLRAFAELEVIGAALFAGIMKVGAITEAADRKNDVGARRLVEDHRKNRLAAATLANSLGLNPASRQALRASGRNGFDLAAAMAQPGRMRRLSSHDRQGATGEVAARSSRLHPRGTDRSRD